MTNEEKWAVIINLKSGKRHFKQQIDYLFRTLEGAAIEYEHRITEFAGHAVLIAKNFAKNGFFNFLIIGGDGTVSEVINGIFSSGITHHHRLKIALIPRGTGNDWARFWGLRRNYQKSIRVFLQKKLQPIDIGYVRYTLEGEPYSRFFINSVGFGLDAAVVRNTNRLRRYIGSHSFLYLVSLIWAILRFKPRNSSVMTGEKEINDQLYTMNIANGCYSGGGMKQNPDALPYDGILDGMMVRKPSFKDIIKALPMLFNGKLLQHPVIESFRTEKIEINNHDGGYFEADGIIVYFASPVEIGILKGAIQMMIP